MNKTRVKIYITNWLIGAGLYNSIEVLYLKNHNISAYMIAILVLFIPVCTAILEIPTGIVGDYLGRVTIFRFTFYSFFLGIFIVAISNTLWLFFVGYFFEALGWSFYSGNSESLIYETCKVDKYDVNSAISYFYSSLTLGYVFSGVFVFVLENVLEAPILQISVCGTVIIRLIAVVIALTTAKKYNETIKNKPKKIIKKSINFILRDRLSIMLCIYEAVGRLQFYLPVLYQPMLLYLGVKIEHVAIIYSLSQLFQAISQRKSVTMIEKFGYKKIMILLPVVQTLAIFLLLTNNVLLIIVGVIVVFSGISMKGQCVSLIRHDKVSNDIRATYLSIMSLITLLINTIFLNGISVINEKNSVFAIIIMGSVLLIASEIVVLSIKDNINKIEAVEYNNE